MKKIRAAAWAASALVTASALTGTLTGPAAATSGKASEPASTAQKPAGGLATATATDGVTHEENDRVPEGSVWTQHYFPSSDGSGIELHADVLLPEKLPKGKRVPVILSAGAYFGHSGQIAPEDWKHTGPSNRFQDFIKGTDLFDQGYAFVMVDTRGFGGSTGCLDFGGPGDQADVKAAIDWSASRPWSTGAVGMYGKSFDALTGLIGNNLDQDALKAVVAQEPVWDNHRLIHSGGVPLSRVVTSATTYNAIASLPQMPDDDARYRANSRYEQSHPECLTENLAGYRITDPDNAYWTARDAAKKAKGTDTPLFFTQGFIEDNTKPEGMQEFLANHKGPERGWVGQWDHVRGNDRTEDGRLAMGREGWFKETLSFYDQYLKGTEPEVRHPAYAVEDNTGAWRAQKTWPVVERSATLRLGGGSYVDDGGTSAMRALDPSGRTKPPKAAKPSGKGDSENASSSVPAVPKGLAEAQVKRQKAGEVTSSFFKWSEPVDQATRITGTPRVSMTVEGEGNVMVKLYDVAKNGTAVMFDEQVSRLDSDRPALDLKSTDWTLKAGHTLAVEIGSVQTGDWLDTPSKQKVRIKDARLELALDDPADDIATGGERSPYLDTYLSQYTVQLPAGSPAFTVPPTRDDR
ncbi:CocE/NonD family hydrolase [Streptomyces yerevanensis]|uniref:CocE/NonD family hydrolase n=1 Tax=Streptomyces yerevanensis TaxID=66378 RepID=UPI00052736CC|nr:CocE/NonD family hydrolase [Streptomyces yerevanensis]